MYINTYDGKKRSNDIPNEFECNQNKSKIESGQYKCESTRKSANMRDIKTSAH